MANVTSVLDLFSKQKVNTNENFPIVYHELNAFVVKLGMEGGILRSCQFQTARNNVPYIIDEFFMNLIVVRTCYINITYKYQN